MTPPATTPAKAPPPAAATPAPANPLTRLRAFMPNRMLLIFSAVILLMPLWLNPIGAAYPDLLQKFAIFGLFAIGFNIFFGLTGYLSFGHAAFLGVGSYAAVWSFKLLTVNVLPAILFGTLMAGVFAVVIGFICLRRSGIYFSILTLALAQMCYSLAYSVLTPITNGETALQMDSSDARVIDAWLAPHSGEGLPATHLFGMEMQGYNGFYFCAVVLIAGFWFSQRIFGSSFGMQLRAIKTNQERMKYSGYNTRPYLLAAFLISGMYAGLAGALMVAIDPLAGAERMQWTASGEVVLMTILGGVGTLIGPMLGVGVIKYFENIFSSYNYDLLLESFSFLPQPLAKLFAGGISPFVGDGWHLTLGVMFMAIVIFLPGGIMEGMQRIRAWLIRGTLPHRVKRLFKPAPLLEEEPPETVLQTLEKRRKRQAQKGQPAAAATTTASTSLEEPAAAPASSTDTSSKPSAPRKNKKRRSRSSKRTPPASS